MNCQAIIDFQAFVDDHNNYIVKELSVIDLQTYASQHWIFKAPYGCEFLEKETIRTNRWLSKHYHKLDWWKGDVNYDQLAKILEDINTKYCVIYVKGSKKKALIKEYIFDSLIIDLEEYGCPSLKHITTKRQGAYCFHHNNNRETTCAVYRINGLAEWLERSRSLCAE